MTSIVGRWKTISNLLRQQYSVHWRILLGRLHCIRSHGTINLKSRVHETQQFTTLRILGNQICKAEHLFLIREPTKHWTCWDKPHRRIYLLMCNLQGSLRGTLHRPAEARLMLRNFGVYSITSDTRCESACYIGTSDLSQSQVAQMFSNGLGNTSTQIPAGEASSRLLLAQLTTNAWTGYQTSSTASFNCVD